MGDPILVDRLDQYGVVADASTAPRGSFSKAQNAIADPLGEKGSIRKRPGLKRFNSTAGAGVIRGGMGVPAPLGGGGLNIGNPFADLSMTIATYTTQVTPTSSPLGGTFDDRGFQYDFDWNFDFSELAELAALAEVGLDDLDLTGGEDASTSTGSQLVPVTLVGDVTGVWSISLDVALAQDADNATTYPNTNPPLIFPTGSVRAYNALGAGTGGMLDAGYPFADVWGATPATREDGYPTAVLNNVLYYVGGYDDYTLDTDPPVLRAYDGYTDRVVARIPKNIDVSATLQPQAIVSLLAANDHIYLSTFDGGTGGATGGTVKGSVYEFNPINRQLTKLGATFPTGYLPYSLAWHLGRLWCGTFITNLADTVAGRIYFIRPGIDTDWTLDKTFSANESMVMALAVFQGRLYAAIQTSKAAGMTAAVYVRQTDATWVTSDTGTTSGSATGEGQGYHSLMTWPPEDGNVTSPTPALYAVRADIAGDAATGAIRKFNGSSWSTVTTFDFDNTGAAALVSTYALSSSSIEPVLWLAQGAGILLNTLNGTAWTDRWASVTTAIGTTMGAAPISMAGMLFQR